MIAFLQDAHTWVLISFLIFVGLAGKPIFRLIAGGLDKRSDEIKNELEAAQKLRAEAEAVLASYQKKQKEAMKEAQDIVYRAREEADALAKTAEEELQASLERRTKLAMEKIAQAEAKAVQDVQNNAVDIAMSAAKSIIIEHLDKSIADELISLATTDIERKVH